MNLKESKALDIEFSSDDFIVDWIDHNIYAFKEKQLFIYSLSKPEYSNALVNKTRKGRSLVIEYGQHFIAWINNENSIIKTCMVIYFIIHGNKWLFVILFL